MKKILFFTLSFFLLQTAFGQEKQFNKVPNKKHISGSFEMNYLRHYLWRGFSFGNNNVAQPTLDLSYKNFTVTLSQNFNYIPKSVPREYYTKAAFFDEQDIEISYTKEWGKWESELAVMSYFYFFQKNTPNTAELYNKTSYQPTDFLKFFTEISMDICQYKGTLYNNVGVTFLKSIDKNNIDIELTSFVGIANKKFNETYSGVSTAGINLLGNTLELVKNINEKYFCKLFVEQNFFLNKAIKTELQAKSNGNYTIAIGINF